LSWSQLQTKEPSPCTSVGVSFWAKEPSPCTSVGVSFWAKTVPLYLHRIDTPFYIHLLLCFVIVTLANIDKQYTRWYYNIKQLHSVRLVRLVWETRQENRFPILEPTPRQKNRSIV
jgi:hypothetical protein